MNTEALNAGVAGLVAVGVYLLLGGRLYLRSVAPSVRTANLQFAAFWLGLAAVTALGAVESLIAVATAPPLALVETLDYLEILLLSVILWSLLGYLLYVFTGKGFLGPLAVIYGALYVVLLYFVTASVPTGVSVTEGSVGLAYATSYSGPLVIVLLVGLTLPEIVGAVLYFTLVFRTQDRMARYRVTLVSWSLIAWFGLAFLDLGALLGGGLVAEILARYLTVIPAIVILIAYYPPASIRNRLGVSTIDAGPTGSNG